MPKRTSRTVTSKAVVSKSSTGKTVGSKPVAKKKPVTRRKKPAAKKSVVKKKAVGGKPLLVVSEPLYTVGEWAKMPQYRCRLCAFDCLQNEIRMLRHLVAAHNSEAALEKLLAYEDGLTTKDTKKHEVVLREPKVDADVFEIEVTEEEMQIIASLQKDAK